MPSEIRNIYIHFLDYYNYRRAVRNNLANEKQVLREARLALRICLLLNDTLFIPASSYFEGPLCRLLLNEVSEFLHSGNIVIVAGDESLGEHLEQKRVMYGRNNSPLLECYKLPSDFNLPYRQRLGDSTRLIENAWRAPIEHDNLLNFLDPKGLYSLSNNLYPIWAKIPEMLDGRAFILDHVNEILSREISSYLPKHKLESLIEGTYTFGYAKYLNAYLMTDLRLLYCHYDSYYIGLKLSFKKTVSAFHACNILRIIEGNDIKFLFNLSRLEKFIQLRDSFNSGFVDGNLVDQLNEIIKETKKITTNRTVIDFYEARKMNICDKVKVGVICALPEEAVAIERSFDELQDNRFYVNNDPFEYSIGFINSSIDDLAPLHIACVCLSRMGNASSAIASANLLRTFKKIKLIVVAGIAAGVPAPSNPDKHIRLGDVLVSDRAGIISYADVTIKDARVVRRSNLPPPSVQAIRAINQLEMEHLRGDNFLERNIMYVMKNGRPINRPSEKTDILLDSNGEKIPHPKQDQRVPNCPMVHRRAIGSADILLRSGDMRDVIAKHFDLGGFEMEGKGAAETAWQLSTSYIVVKGVCDYGDGSKNDTWHEYAAIVAASYFRSVIQKIRL